MSYIYIYPVFLCPTSATVSAQPPTGSSQDSSCSSVLRYIQTHPGCAIVDRIFVGFSTCSNILCSLDKSYLNAVLHECPVSVYIQFELYYVTKVIHVFSQSETVETQGSNGDTWKYTGIMARNASHLGFEVCSCSIEYLSRQCEHEGYHSFCCSYILTIFVTSNFFV